MEVHGPPPAPPLVDAMKPALFDIVFRRCLLPLLIVVGSVFAATSAIAADLEPKVQAYLQTHCIGCHRAGSTMSDFRIDTLSAKVGFEDSPQWLEVMERISSGEMPPKEEKNRPSADESARHRRMAIRGA